MASIEKVHNILGGDKEKAHQGQKSQSEAPEEINDRSSQVFNVA